MSEPRSPICLPLLGWAVLMLSACGGGPTAADVSLGLPDLPSEDTPGPDRVDASDQPETDRGDQDAADLAGPDAVDLLADGPDGDGPSGDGTPPDAPDAGPTCELSACTAYAAPVASTPATSTAINEISGIAASAVNPGVFYVHNDSGDQARFFAIDQNTQILAELALTGATNIDWEDIAVGPCDAGSCVFLGEIGDNAKLRTDYVIYRLTEPAVTAGQPAAAPVTVTFDRFPFSYPDGSHNAETLLVHPRTGDIYIVTKALTGNLAGVYRMARPQVPDQSVILEKVTDLPDVTAACGFPITGGALHPCGDRLLLRSRTKLCEFRLAPGASFEALFGTTPAEVPVATEGQGESVTYAADGRGYYTISEGVFPVLNQVSCQ